MTSELLSGPDLGAGFLHQLSLDRDGERTSVTYHAQDGGADANGPPKGPLDAFGFVHPPVPCMFGGPRCWHRRFLLPFTALARARQAYNRHRFVLQAMLDQTYDHAAVPIEAALDELLPRISDQLARDGVEWYIGGSTAARLLGARVAPHDIDLGTTRAGVDRIGTLLGEFLIEPVAPTDWPSSGIVHGARAFVGTLQDGVRVEWAVPIEPRTPVPFDEWSGRGQTARTVEAAFHGHSVRVSRPEYALVRAHERHRTADAAAIATVVHQLGPDGALLDALLARSTLSEPRRQELRRVTLGDRLG
ncbi:MAG TPA: hypothetical protein VEG66_00140 [Thermoplasmata archaeon]|jgi:hypothetical protein|nr:hypothetical protein [Thermoplasmata archaeon]